MAVSILSPPARPRDSVRHFRTGVARETRNPKPESRIKRQCPKRRMVLRAFVVCRLTFDSDFGLRVAHSGWRDVSWWYQFEVPPADVPAIEAAIMGGTGIVVEIRTSADVSPPVADYSDAPFWWDPERLPDA